LRITRLVSVPTFQSKLPGSARVPRRSGLRRSGPCGRNGHSNQCDSPSGAQCSRERIRQALCFGCERAGIGAATAAPVSRAGRWFAASLSREDAR
jgi:hypothetical protein